MAYDYDKLYGETPNALGDPTQVLVDFFDKIEIANARILDVGCGQGRDALYLAGKGHSVVGVDISQNGIDDLVKAAQTENLAIEGVVADLTNFAPEGVFDYILIDRTLHMLDEPDRLAVLKRLLGHTNANGWVLIADQASNIPGFEGVFQQSEIEWSFEYMQRGYLFASRL